MLKNKLKLFILLAVTMLAILSCGCDKTEEKTEPTDSLAPPQTTGCEVAGDQCACLAENSVFDIDNVTVTFCYGSSFGLDIQKEIKEGRNIPYVELNFIDEDNNRTFIKRTEDYYTSEKYRCDIVEDELGRWNNLKFNHSEDIKIPAELFTKDKGEIIFAVEGKDVNKTGVNALVRAYVGINYEKITDSKVRLSSRPIDFSLDEIIH